MSVATLPDVSVKARRPRHPMRHAAVLAALLALPLLPVLNGAATDTGWSAVGGEARLHVGAEVHTRRAIADGQLPLWNPYEFGGRPHLADPDTLTLYVPHVVLRLLPMGVDRFFAASFVLHAWIFAIGAYLTARELGGMRVASWLASMGVTLATAVNPWAEAAYSSSLYSLAWLPLLIGLCLRSLRAGERRAETALVAVAVVALTGPVRGQLYAVAAIALCHLFWAAWPAAGVRRPRRTLVRLAVVVTLAAGLAAFQLVPQLRYLTAAERAGGLARQSVRGRSVPDSLERSAGHLAASMAALDEGRVMSQCQESLDVTRFLRLGVPAIDGYGGAFLADYGRYARLVSDTRGEPAQGPATLGTPVRPDLLGLMNVAYAVTCDEPGADEWSRVGEVGGAAIARAGRVLPRVFWTCAPRRVTREELVYRLTTSRYDGAVTLLDANPVVHVRWAADIDEPARRAVERSLKLRLRRFVDGRTWQYDLVDPTRANLAALVNHPAAEDTAGFDRGTLTFPPPADPPAFTGRRAEWLLGIETCEDVRPATIEEADRADGHLVATVEAPRDGIIFVSETYFAGRNAWLDGVRVDPIKVNLAFTGVPVTAGTHRLQLRADPTPLHAGAGLSLATLIAWMLYGWRAQRH